MTSLVWFREDLRITDNPALNSASKKCETSGAALVCLYIIEDCPEIRPLGGAAKWWLHHSLSALSADIAQKGNALLLLRGDPKVILPELVVKYDVKSVDWNRRYTPKSTQMDAGIKSALTQNGISVQSHKANVLFEPWEVRNQSGNPFKVFTPFWRAAMHNYSSESPLPAPKTLPSAPKDLSGKTLMDFGLLPHKPNWAKGFHDYWHPGEEKAHKALTHFLDQTLGGYQTNRDIPAGETTSRLSPHLRWGEISPKQIFAKLETHMPTSSSDINKFKAEIGWRDFARNIHFHAHDLETQNWKPEFNAFPWRKDPDIAADLKAWQTGQTGYALVDAGMRALWQSGWMHNRVRMVVGSFLVKHLLIDWRVGEEWFWDTLVDADPSTNPASWQWIAGCGADAAPYFRIFNPYTQAEKFDPKGHYARKWKASDSTQPIINHKDARARALAAYQSMRASD